MSLEHGMITWHALSQACRQTAEVVLRQTSVKLETCAVVCMDMCCGMQIWGGGGESWGVLGILQQLFKYHFWGSLGPPRKSGCLPERVMTYVIRYVIHVRVLGKAQS